MTTNRQCAIQRRTSQRGRLQGAGLVVCLLLPGGCEAGQPAASVAVAQDAIVASADPEEGRMWMTIGERRFAVTLADTAAARAFATHLPQTLDMAELNGNEKHADVSEALPTEASRPGTIHAGDLMLYGANTVVIFYQTFRSPYAYTRLGRVDDSAGLTQALGRRSVQVTFSAD